MHLHPLLAGRHYEEMRIMPLSNSRSSDFLCLGFARENATDDIDEGKLEKLKKKKVGEHIIT